MHALLMVLVYIDWKRKWRSSYKDCPLAGPADDESVPAGDGAGLGEDTDSDDSSDSATAAGLMPEAGPSTSRTTVAQGRQQVNEKRKLCANAMTFSARLLAQPLGMRLFKALIITPRPLHARMAQELEMLKTRRGTLALHVGLQQGEHTPALHELLDTFLSHGVAEQLGFPKARGPGRLQNQTEDAMEARLLRHHPGQLHPSVAFSLLWLAGPSRGGGHRHLGMAAFSVGLPAQVGDGRAE